MPNVRAKGQTLVSFPLEKEFLAKLDAARRNKSRSQFIREAIYREVKSTGIIVDPKMIFAPDRASAIHVTGNNNRTFTVLAADSGDAGPQPPVVDRSKYSARKKKKK